MQHLLPWLSFTAIIALYVLFRLRKGELFDYLTEVVKFGEKQTRWVKMKTLKINKTRIS